MGAAGRRLAAAQAVQGQSADGVPSRRDATTSPADEPVGLIHGRHPQRKLMAEYEPLEN
jgi:hypothetical protein